MDSDSGGLSSQSTDGASGVVHPTPPGQHSQTHPLSSTFSASGISSWARNLKLPQSFRMADEDAKDGNSGTSTFARFTSNIGLRIPSMAPVQEDGVAGTTATAESGVLESLKKGVVDSSRTALKAVQTKARHIVSQNKRRYMEDGFDLDMAYITDNIIAMGFPAGDKSSGLFGIVEGFYRNHMDEVIMFFETHHKGKYKVYNLCSERLYDASLFQGKVANFPFEDHNCPPLHLIKSFCQSAYSWLKEDVQNVIVVHCKAGMGRTGLMICSLLLYLKLFATANEAIDHFNQRRCVDGKALVLPSQIRYVKYFEHILTNFNGEIQPGRRCMLRGFRLHKCPNWVRPSITISNHNGILVTTRKHPKTKDLMPEDFWINRHKKGIVVFALPGEPGIAELEGDFKIHFHERQGDFYCWLNTTMTENRKILDVADLDGFDKRNFPSPGFQVEVVMIDYNGTLPARPRADSAGKTYDGSTGPSGTPSAHSSRSRVPRSKDNDEDDIFSDSDGEDAEARNKPGRAATRAGPAAPVPSPIEQIGGVTRGASQLSLDSEERVQATVAKEPAVDGAVKPSSAQQTPNVEPAKASDFKAMAADASVFTFGDDEDFDSE